MCFSDVHDRFDQSLAPLLLPGFSAAVGGRGKKHKRGKSPRHHLSRPFKELSSGGPRELAHFPIRASQPSVSSPPHREPGTRADLKTHQETRYGCNMPHKNIGEFNTPAQGRHTRPQVVLSMLSRSHFIIVRTFYYVCKHEQRLPVFARAPRRCKWLGTIKFIIVYSQMMSKAKSG